MEDDDYSVSSGNQETTYKDEDGLKSEPETPEPDDSYDRSEHDGGHLPTDDDDVLIDQSTYKDRPRSD